MELHSAVDGARRSLLIGRRRLTHRIVYPLTELTYALAFGLLGRIVRPERYARHWAAHGSDRVVVVAPHPDDETIGAGGVIALHVASGDRVSLVVVTDGGNSQAGGLPRATMIKRRQSELCEAADVLGVNDVVCLRLSEGNWEPRDATRLLIPLTRGADIIYAPSCVDYHPEHVAVARALALAVRPGQVLRAYEVGVPLTPVLTNLVADISATAATKARALAAHVTQAESIAPIRRLHRYESCLYRFHAVEAFWELGAEAYSALMAAGDSRSSSASTYRGMTPHAVADPLAFAAGGRERRALRRLAASG